MLFLVEMEVHLPHDLPAEQVEEVKARERDYAQDLQYAGTWRHLWRVVGRYANVSVFDVESTDELHSILGGLPLFPYMDIHVTALADHPSAIEPEIDLPLDVYRPDPRDERRAP
jgi:muconolactone D-isomerase